MKLFNDGDELFRKDSELIRKYWHLPYVQYLAKSDISISYFIEGIWKTKDKGYYFEIGEDWHSNYNIPAVSNPYGTKYYDIVSMNYIWTDENSKELAKVFEFEIVDFDTIKVYCYNNDITYTLYREK